MKKTYTVLLFVFLLSMIAVGTASFFSAGWFSMILGQPL